MQFFWRSQKSRESFGVSTSLFIHLKKNVSKCIYFTETQRKTSNFDISTYRFCFILKMINYLKKNSLVLVYRSSTVLALTSSLLLNSVIGLFKIYSIFLSKLLWLSIECTRQTLNFSIFFTRLDKFLKGFYTWSLSFPEITIAIETVFLPFFCSFWKSQTNTALQQYIQVTILIDLIIYRNEKVSKQSRHIFKLFWIRSVLLIKNVFEKKTTKKQNTIANTEAELILRILLVFCPIWAWIFL